VGVGGIDQKVEGKGREKEPNRPRVLVLRGTDGSNLREPKRPSVVNKPRSLPSLAKDVIDCN